MCMNLDNRYVVATLTLGLQPWARNQGKGLQGFEPRGKPKSEGKCEGMNPHTPKGASTLGVEVPMDSQIFKERLQGSNPMD